MRLVRYRPSLILCLILGIHVFFYLWGHSGLESTDDLFYSNLAHDISKGTFELTPSIFENRFGVIAPTALSYSIFGVNKYSTTLWPLTCSLITIIVVFIVSRNLYGVKAAFLASSLLATNLSQVKYASSLYPEITLSMFMVMGLATHFLARRTENVGKQFLLAAISAFSFLAALFTKMTVVWVLPFILVVLIYDLRAARNLKLCFFLICMGIVTAVIYFGGYYVFTGDMLYRFSGIKEEFNVQWGFQGVTTFDYIRRLTYEPLLFFLSNPRYSIPLVLSLPALLSVFLPRLRMIPGLRFWSVYTLVFIAAFWFGSTSFTSYMPIPLREEQRFLLPLLAPLAILGGTTLAALWTQEANQVRLLGLSGIVVSSGFFVIMTLAVLEGRWDSAVLYASLLVTILALIPLSRNIKFVKKIAPEVLTKAGVIAIILIFLASPILGVLVGALGERPWEKAQRQIAQEQLLPLKEPVIIFTDSRSTKALPFFFGYDVPSHINFLDWNKEYQTENFKNHKCLVYVNKRRVEALNFFYDEPVPKFIDIQPPDWKLIDGEEGVYLFALNSVQEFSAIDSQIR